METLRRLLLLIFFCAGTLFVMAQQKKTYSGIVRDDAGNPLQSITVRVKGTNTFATTDVNGAYSLSTSKTNAKLEFTGVGFSTQELDSETTTNVAMVVKANELNEVVVVGFGQKKATRNLAYAVQEVKGADLARAGQVNIINSLQGKVAGVMINQGAGGPSSSSRIRIRGNASLGNNTMPLMVIDGVLIQPGTSGADSWGGGSRDFGNQMKNLNPDDYESLTVLKGSAASALYGSQAINGVIIITTKKGRDRPGLGVQVNQTNTIEQAWRFPAFQNEFGAGINPFFSKGAQGEDALLLDGNTQFRNFGPRMDGRIITDFDGVKRPFVGNNIKDFYRTGKINNTNVAVEGSTDKSSFRFSYTNTTNEAVLDRNKFARNNFNLRASQKIGKFITMDASVSYANSKTDNPMEIGGNSPIFRFLFFNVRNLPIDFVRQNYISPNGGSNISPPYTRGANIGPLWQMYQVNVNQSENQLLANMDITAKIRPWLTLLVRGNINSLDMQFENKTPGDGVNFGIGPNFAGSYEIMKQNQRDLRIQTLLTANRKIGENFDYSITVGGETQRGLGGTQLTSNSNGGLRIPRIFTLANSMQAATTRLGVVPQRRLDAVYAYGDITWKNMLTFTGSIRNDWSSTLLYPDGSGDNSYLYPSLGTSWAFTELLGNKAKWLNFGKLRVSAGWTGSDVRPFLTTFGNYGLLENFILPNGTAVPRYGLPNFGLGNQQLTPERTKEIEIGVDLRMFNNRIRVDAAYYKKNTLNQALGLANPSETGAPSRLINAGNIQNQGIEIVLSGTVVSKKDFEYTTTINYSRNRNKIIALAPGVDQVELDLVFGNDVRSVARVGKDYGTVISNYAYATGANDAKLLNADGQFLRRVSVGQGFKELGTVMERFLASNLHEVRYKNFNFFAQVDSKIGGLMASHTHQYTSQTGALQSTLRGRTKESGGLTWTDPQGNVRDDGMIPDGIFRDGTIINGQNVAGMTFKDAVDKGLRQPLPAWRYYENLASWATGIREHSVFENSWVVVREVSVGYEVPKSVVKKIRFQKLRVSLIGRNLFYLYTTTPDHINPENIWSSRPGAFGELGGSPWIRTFALAINAGF